MRIQHLKQKMTRLTAVALIVTMSASPAVSWAAPGVDAQDVLDLLEDDEHAEFEMLRSKWKKLLAGGGLDVTNQLVRDYAESVDIVAEKLWDSMIKLGEAAEDTRTCLFADLPLTDKSSRTGSSEITLTLSLIHI